MEPREVAEQIREATEEEKQADVHFRRRAAVGIGVLAMLLAIAALGGNSATREMISDNILAADTWAFFQAKTIRQTSQQLAATQLEALLASHPTMPPEARGVLQQAIERAKATAARYESEPSQEDPSNPLKGEGRKELRKRAEYLEHKRDHAEAQLPHFEYAEALFQIAIVLGSVSIVATSRPLFGAGIALGLVAILFMLNGFFLIVPIWGR